MLGLPQPDALNPSIGQMEIIHSNFLGGTFESCLGNSSDAAGVCNILGVPGGGVYSNAIATIVGGDPSNPLDVFFSAQAPRLAVSGLNGTWIHSLDGEGNLLVNDIQHDCNFPQCHPVDPTLPSYPLIFPIPEPGTAPLAGLGLLGLSGIAARRRVRRNTRKAFQAKYSSGRSQDSRY